MVQDIRILGSRIRFWSQMNTVRYVFLARFNVHTSVALAVKPLNFPHDVVKQKSEVMLAHFLSNLRHSLPQICHHILLRLIEEIYGPEIIMIFTALIQVRYVCSVHLTSLRVFA